MSRPDVDPRLRDALAVLAGEEPIDGPVVVVVAHPDDETLGLGAQLARFRDALVLQVTDGAPRDGADARAAGCDGPQAYAGLREKEFASAMAALGASPRREVLDVPDQGASDALAAIARQLVPRLQGAAWVITHPYEGGHPDHDAAAFAVQRACAGLGDAAPLRMEFASYHGRDGRFTPGAFWPDADCPETVVQLGPQALARKRAALGCYASQRAIVEGFRPEVERYRAAPTYDFTRPPPPGAALYDGYGWPLSSAEWRARAAASLTQP